MAHIAIIGGTGPQGMGRGLRFAIAGEAPRKRGQATFPTPQSNEINDLSGRK
jgi:hypothetical protein